VKGWGFQVPQFKHRGWDIYWDTFNFFLGKISGIKKISIISWVTQQMSHPSCWNGVILGGIVLPGTNSNPKNYEYQKSDDDDGGPDISA
jgi:hypothetical protein